MKSITNEARGKAAARRPKGSATDEEEERILRLAQVYFLFEAKRPMLGTVAGIKKGEGPDNSRRRHYWEGLGLLRSAAHARPEGR